MSENNNKDNQQKKEQQSRPPVRFGRGGPHAMMKGEKARDFKGTFKRLVQYLGKYNLLILVVLTLAGASTVFAILGPKILGSGNHPAV
jgi:ATP-binding cassette, subfamily B, multidrug efflux pump